MCGVERATGVYVHSIRRYAAAASAVCFVVGPECCVNKKREKQQQDPCCAHADVWYGYDKRCNARASSTASVFTVVQKQ